MVVRLDRDYRQSFDDIKNLTVALPDGHQIPLEQIADISIKSGPAQVSRENTKRRITIGFNVRNRDIQSVIKDVTAQIDEKIQLPTGYYVTYGGQFKNLEAAQKRLSIAVPIALLLIFVLLYFTFHSVKQSLLIFTAVPMSAIGGVFALWLRGMNFSISAGIGFIALFGVAVLNGIVLIAEFNRLEKEGVIDITERVLKGLNARLRSVILTGAAPALGFLPMVISTSAGAEVQKPLATVVIGGLITATILTLIILPVLYIIFSSGRFNFHLKSRSVKSLPILIFLILGSSLLNSANAQQKKSINLHDAIQMALDSNLAIKSAAFSIDAQKALRGASLDLPKTVIDGQYGQFNSYSNDNSFSVSQAFDFPSVYVNKAKLANANIKGVEWQLKVSQLEIATQVKQVYWEYVYLTAKQKLLSYQDSLYAGFLRAAELRAKTGETNRLEMITARSQSLEIKNQLYQVNADMDIYIRKLKILLNSNSLPIPEEINFRRIDYSFLSDSSSVARNPSLGYIQHKIEISRLEKKLERSRMLPDLNVGYFSQTIIGTQDVNGIPRSFDQNYRFTGVQAGISIPLWFPAYTSKAKAAEISENIARIDADYYTSSLNGNYHSLLDEFRKFSATVDYYEQQAVPEANLIIDQATRGYKAGALDYLEYVLTLNRALAIRQNYLDALNNCNQTIISIEYITGKIF
jgi:cobalt-zinc-cadmium resistance protein CzcA